MAGQKVTVDVGGRTLALSNLDKVLYPETGFTKGEVIDYYRQISEVLLPHISNRLLTRKRWPDGTAKDPFFEKNTPRGTPDWVRTVEMPEHGDEGVEYVVCDDLPTLVWLANLAALELHVPQWQVPERAAPKADLLVFDLDPGAPADIIDCCNVALAVRQLVDADGLTAVAKTSGNKGAQLYVPVEPTSTEATSTYARTIAQRLQEALPDLVVASMDKKARGGKVFIDWSQNNSAKTTIAPYSMRGRAEPTVSTPISWDEVSDATEASELVFTTTDVLERVSQHGDLMADLARSAAPLP